MLLDQEFYQNPYPEYRTLREAGAIHWVDMLGGVWVLTRYHDIVQAFNDLRLSSERSAVFVDQFGAETTQKLKTLNQITAGWAIFRDPPVHTLLRKTLMQAFNRTALNTLQPYVESLANAYLMQITPGDTFDFMRQYASPLQADITFHLLGIEPDDREWFLTKVRDIINFLGRIEPNRQQVFCAQESLFELAEYFRSHLAQWREEPPNGLIGYLLEAEATHNEVTEMDVVSQCTLFFIAGNVNTPGLLGNALLTLLQHPQQLALLMQNESIYSSAIRELLRYQTADQFVARRASTDFTLLGKSIKQGDGVLLLLASANRDPERFTEPERLDLMRDEGHPLSLGSGIHTCIGGQLAKLELEVTLKALFNRFERLELIDPEPDWSDIFGFRHLSTLFIQTYLKSKI